MRQTIGKAGDLGGFVALHAMYYNFARIHQTLKVSPAMAACVTDRLWEMKDVVEMIEAFEAKRNEFS